MLLYTPLCRRNQDKINNGIGRQQYQRRTKSRKGSRRCTLRLSNENRQVLVVLLDDWVVGDNEIPA